MGASSGFPLQVLVTSPNAQGTVGASFGRLLVASLLRLFTVGFPYLSGRKQQSQSMSAWHKNSLADFLKSISKNRIQ
jgi:hypothetical protein